MFKLLLFVIAVAHAKTVRYSNVPPRAAIATKTYDLEVPGSAPIRIIEAEPIWSPEEVKIAASHENAYNRKKHKTGKEFTTTETAQPTLSEPVTFAPEPTTNFSVEALNLFLKDYAEKIKEGRKKYDVTHRDTTTEEPINKLASIYLENDRMDNVDKDRLKSWGLMDTKHHKHPYEDKKGWVTLEAVPWSTSKISKWQSHHKPELKPWENHSNSPNRPQSNWNNRFSNNPYDKNPFLESADSYNGSPNHFPSDNNFNNGYDNQHNPNDNIFYDKPVAHYDVDIIPAASDYSRPQKIKPSYIIDAKPIKIKPEMSDWPEELPSKPSWSSRPPTQNNWNSNPVPDPWADRNTPQHAFMYGSQGYKDENRDIITDNRPSDFPKPQNSYQNYETIQERPTLATTDSHPPTHPLNGNGEWVLLSTTKGYQYPRNKRQRSIEVTPDSIGTRRGIRLTVLPPDNDGNVNMTTSHGGLLEVESTFETVEESHNKHVEAMQDHHRPNRNKFPGHKNNKKPVKSFVITNRPNPNTSNSQNRPSPVRQGTPNDATAVLAAVGAGMVPATMAMLLPFAGRKKRDAKINLHKSINSSFVPRHIFTNVQSS